MSATVRIAVCDPTEASRDILKKHLLGLDNIWLEADCSSYGSFLQVVEQTEPEVAIVHLDADPDEGASSIEAINEKCPECSVIAVSSSSDGQLILRAVRAGAREFLNWPLRIEDLIAALDRVAVKSDGSGRKSRTGCAVAVAGASGGVGATSVAVNLACALAQDPSRSVVLVDLDVSLGDADVYLDTIPEYTLLDVAQNISRLDLSMLRKSLTKHESGVYLLPRPVQLQDLNTISRENFSRVLGLLKASFTHLVIDMSKAYNHLDMIALKTAEHILMVTQLDLPCLRNVVRLMMSFEDYEGMSDKVRIVVNRSGLDSQIGIKKATETIGREIFWQLPNDYAVVSECRNSGIPFVRMSPKSDITASIQALAEKLSGNGDPAETSAGTDGGKSKKGWLSFLNS